MLPTSHECDYKHRRILGCSISHLNRRQRFETTQYSGSVAINRFNYLEPTSALRVRTLQLPILVINQVHNEIVGFAYALRTF